MKPLILPPKRKVFLAIELKINKPSILKFSNIKDIKPNIHVIIIVVVVGEVIRLREEPLAKKINFPLL